MSQPNKPESEMERAWKKDAARELKKLAAILEQFGPEYVVEVTPQEAPEFWRRYSALCDALGMTGSRQAGAAAEGREPPSIYLTPADYRRVAPEYDRKYDCFFIPHGLAYLLDPGEMISLLAHESSHKVNYEEEAEKQQQFSAYLDVQRARYAPETLERYREATKKAFHHTEFVGDRLGVQLTGGTYRTMLEKVLDPGRDTGSDTHPSYADRMRNIDEALEEFPELSVTRKNAPGRDR